MFLFFLCSIVPSVIFGQDASKLLHQQVEKFLSNPQELFAIYSNHAKHQSNELVTLLDDIHRDIYEQTQSNEFLQEKKHILTILTDDQGWGDIGYNDPTFVTPTLDYLAGHGIKFDNFYVHVR